MLQFLLLAALAGQDDKAVEDALEKFKTDFKASSDADRARALTTLSGTAHLKTLNRIAPFVAADTSVVRIAAAKALGGFTEFRKQAAPALLRGLGANAKEPAVLIAVLEALGKLGDGSALPSLYKYFDEKDGKIAAAAFLAVGEIGSTSSVEPLIEALKKLERAAKDNGGGGNIAGAGGAGGAAAGYNVPDDDTARRRAKEVQPAAVKALQAIAKEKYITVEEWQKWWARTRATLGK